MAYIEGVRVVAENIFDEDRFSDKGMWGRASYFAQNASYSHKYGYRLTGAHMQMFLARVVVGKSHRIINNNI